MDRRQFLKASSFLSGGFAIGAVAKLAADPGFTAASGTGRPNALTQAKLSPDQVEQLAWVCETIIPRTDTPGAMDAAVPEFVLNMVNDWLSTDERKVFLEGLAELQSLSAQEHSAKFAELETQQRIALLESLENDAQDSPWYDFGNIQRDYVEGAPFICQIKELTIFGFYSSEVGAKQVLRHKPMPMSFDGELALGQEDSSWSTIRTM